MTAYLLRLHDGRLAGERFEVATGTFVLGRSSRCDLLVNDPTISRRHAKIAVAEGSMTVTDLGSMNGTYLDEKQVREASVVAEGQRLRFGSVSFLVSMNQADVGEPDSALETEKCDPFANGRSPALSQAQTRVLEQLLDGLAEKQIAARLCLSQHTVHNHVRAIFQSFHVHSRAQLLSSLLQRDGQATVQKMVVAKGGQSSLS